MQDDDARTRAAIAAYQDAMRRCMTWRHAIRAALTAADAIEGVGATERYGDGTELYAALADQLRCYSVENYPKLRSTLYFNLSTILEALDIASKVTHDRV